MTKKKPWFLLETDILIAPKKVVAIHVLGHLRASVIGPSEDCCVHLYDNSPNFNSDFVILSNLACTQAVFFLSQRFLQFVLFVFSLFLLKVSFLSLSLFISSTVCILSGFIFIMKTVSALKTIIYNIINYICWENSINTHKCTQSGKPNTANDTRPPWEQDKIPAHVKLGQKTWVKHQGSTQQPFGWAGYLLCWDSWKAGRCTGQHQSWTGIQSHKPNVIRILREGWLVLFIHLLLHVCLRWGWGGHQHQGDSGGKESQHGYMYHKDEENNQGGHRGWMWGADGVLEDDKEWFRTIEDSRGCDSCKNGFVGVLPRLHSRPRTCKSVKKNQ